MYDNAINDRMKNNYEKATKFYLTKRMPTIIRVDMCGAKKFTEKMFKPFDSIFISCMHYAMRKTAKNIQNCKFAYTQSDEISFFLRDYDNLTTEQWRNGNIQKMASIAASLATFYFNQIYTEILHEFRQVFLNTENQMLEDELKYLCKDWDIDYNKIIKDDFNKFSDAYCGFDGSMLNKQAIFDGRVFTIPKEEVCNYFIARMQDASRNSIYMTAFSQFSHKELQGLNGSQLQDKLFNEKGINWNDLPTFEKRGMCYYRGTTVEDRGWNLDLNIPIFTQNRDYIERLV